MIEIITPGPLLTVQDLGRPSARRFGVATGGAMDSFALQAANLLVGNPADAAGLEITIGGAELVLQRPALIALTGGDLGARLNGRPLQLWAAVAISPGATLRFGGRPGGWGARAYLAVAGGIAVPPVLGSRSTDLAGGFGGLHGRPLRPGDRLRTGPALSSLIPTVGRHWPTARRPAYSPEPLLRIIPGPHIDCFMPGALADLCSRPLQISPTSNRMGYRLEGLTLPYARPTSLASLGVVPGSIQVPPDGAPILLMADAQTTGGYPLIGALAGADLPLAAQLLPGDSLRLRVASLDEALAARQAQATALASGPEPDEGDLLTALAGA